MAKSADISDYHNSREETDATGEKRAEVRMLLNTLQGTGQSHSLQCLKVEKLPRGRGGTRGAAVTGGPIRADLQAWSKCKFLP